MAKNHPQPKNPKEHLQQMNILYLALLGGQLMMAAILYFALGEQSVTETEEATATIGGLNPMILFGIAIFVAGASASFFMYNKRKKEGAQLTGTLMEKLSHYRASFILRAALLEGPNLMVMIFFFFIESNIILIALFGIGIGLFLAIRPTVDRIIQDYELSGAEQSGLRNAGF